MTTPKIAYNQCPYIHARASEAGTYAALNLNSMLIDTKAYAHITVHPGNSTYARWAKNNLEANRPQSGGMRWYIRHYWQSSAHKAAYAAAYVRVLRLAGIDSEYEAGVLVQN